MSNMQQYAMACSALPFLPKAFTLPAVLHDFLHPSEVALSFALMFISPAPPKCLAGAEPCFGTETGLTRGQVGRGQWLLAW